VRTIVGIEQPTRKHLVLILTSAAKNGEHSSKRHGVMLQTILK
jgi:hypothetical protein